MAAFEEIEARLSLNADEFRNGIQGAASDLDTLEGRASATSKAVAGLGAAAGAAAVGGLAKSVTAAADFDAAMNESLSIMGDVSSAMEDDMASAAREVARTTSHSAEEAAESFYFLSSAGLDAQESIAAMPEVAEFAQAGQMDMAEATDAATNVMSAFGVEAENMSEVTDVMTATVTNHNQTMEGMAGAFKNAAPAASSMGIEMEELAAATGVLGDVGIQAEEAGSAMSSIMRRMAKRSGEAGKALDSLGVETTDAAGNLLPLTDIIAQLEDKQLSSAEASMIFGRQASAGMALVDAGADNLENYTNRIAEAGGITQEVAEKQLQTLNEQWGLLMDNLNDIAIGIGQVFLPAITSAASVVIDAVQSFAAFNEQFDGLPGAIALVSTAVGGLGAALYALQGTAIAAAVPSLGAIATAAGIVGTAIVGVTAIIGTAAAAWKTNFGGIQDETQALIDQVSGPFTQTLSALKSTVTTVTGTFRSAWQDATSGVESSVARVVTAIRERLGGAISGVLSTATGHLNAFRNRWVANSDQIEARIGGLLSSIGGIASRIASALGPAAAFVRDTFQATLESAFGAIVDTGQTLVDLVIDIGTRFGLLDEDTSTAAEALGQLLDPFNKVELAVSSLDQSFSLMTDAWDTNWGSIRTTTTEAASAVSQQFTGMETSAGTSMGGIQTTMRETLFTAYNRLVTRTREALGQVGTEFTNWMTATRGTFGMFWQIVNEILIPVFTTIVSTIRENLGTVDGIVDVHLSGLISEFLRTMTHINENIIQPVLAAILALWNRYGDEILTIVELVWDTIGSVVSIALDSLATTIRVIMAAIRGDWGEAWDLIKGLLTRTLDEILSYASEWGGRFLSWLGGLVEDWIQAFKDLAYSLIGGSVIPEMFADILSAARGFGSDLLSWLSGMASDFISDVRSFASDVVGEFRSMGRDALDAITSLDFLGAGRDMVSDLVSGIRDKIPSVEDAASAVAGAYDRYMGQSDAETGPLSNLTEYGPTVVNTFAEGMTDNLGTMARAASEVAAAAEPEPSPRPAGVTPPRPTPAGGSDTTVVENHFDFGDLDDDDYVSVGALKQMIREERRNEEERKLKRGST